MLLALSRLMMIVPHWVSAVGVGASIFLFPFLCIVVVISVLLSPLFRRRYSLRQLILIASLITFTLLIQAVSLLFVLGNPEMLGGGVDWVVAQIFLVFHVWFGDHWLTAVLSYVTVFWPMLFVVTYALQRWIGVTEQPAVRGSAFSRAWIMTTVCGIVGLVAAGSVVFFVEHVSNLCSRVSQQGFHIFHAHIKNLCAAETVEFCPRSIEQLRAFNPGLFSQLEQCNHPEYEYITDTGAYRWSVRFGQYTLVATRDDDFYIE